MNRFLIFVPELTLLLGLIFTTHASATEISNKAFLSLPSDDQVALFSALLEERDQVLKNLIVQSVTRNYNVTYKDGKTGEPIPGKDNGRYETEIRFLDGDYWARIDWYLPDDSDNVPTMHVETTIDVSEGRSRSKAKHGHLSGVYGAIDTKEDMLIKANRFHYWFDGDYDEPDAFIFKFLRRHLSQIQFSDHTTITGDPDLLSRCVFGLIETFDKKKKINSTYEFVFDPQRGFLPVMIHGKLVYGPSSPNAGVIRYEYNEVIHEAKEIDGVWFPWKTEIIAANQRSIQDGYATVNASEAKIISIDQLNSDDLTVEFEPGTEVNDRIKGEWIHVGDEAGFTNASAEKSGGFSNKWWILVVNLIVAGVFLIVFGLVKRRKKTTDT